MNTHRLQMPQPAKKQRLRKNVWAVLVAVVAACLFLFYSFVASQGFHNERLLDPTIVVKSGSVGMLDLQVKAGQQIPSGAYMGSVGGAEKKKALEELETQLLHLALALPPEYGGYMDSTGKREAGAFSDEALRVAVEAETAARKDLNSAAMEESLLAVEARKMLQRQSRGEADKNRVEEAQERHTAAQAGTALLRAEFEAASLHRAAIEKERSRIREIQRESGLESLPAAARIQQYEMVKAQHAALKAAYEASVFFAGYPSLVLAVHAAHKTPVEAGQPIVSLRPVYGYTLTVTADVSRLYVRQVREGDICSVFIDSYGENSLEGIVSAIVPHEGGWRRYLPSAMQLAEVIVDVPIPPGGSIISPDSSVRIVLQPAPDGKGAKEAGGEGIRLETVRSKATGNNGPDGASTVSGGSNNKQDAGHGPDNTGEATSGISNTGESGSDTENTGKAGSGTGSTGAINQTEGEEPGIP